MHAAPCAASSVTMALPTGWVAPVTMQTKPYCGRVSRCSRRWQAMRHAYELAVWPVRREVFAVGLLLSVQGGHPARRMRVEVDRRESTTTFETTSAILACLQALLCSLGSHRFAESVWQSAIATPRRWSVADKASCGQHAAHLSARPNEEAADELAARTPSTARRSRDAADVAANPRTGDPHVGDEQRCGDGGYRS